MAGIGNYQRPQLGAAPRQRSIYRTATATPVFTSIPATRQASPSWLSGLARRPGWAAAAPEAAPTIDGSTAQLLGAVLGQFQQGNLTGEVAQVIGQIAKQVEENSAVTFPEFMRDLTRATKGIISAVGRTLDPKEQPRRYKLSKVTRLLGDQLGPLFDTVTPFTSTDVKEAEELEAQLPDAREIQSLQRQVKQLRKDLDKVMSAGAG